MCKLKEIQSHIGPIKMSDLDYKAESTNSKYDGTTAPYHPNHLLY